MDEYILYIFEFSTILQANYEMGDETSPIYVSIKGNMHHKYDVSSKYAFHIIDLAARIFF